ncbi:MAG: hypothetical protein KDB22_20965 [Planctomycetales bacterium]|nr:hypothetical protein [Planctomycetales bacterium]
MSTARLSLSQSFVGTIVFILSAWLPLRPGLAQEPVAENSVGSIFLQTERIPYKHRVQGGYQYFMMRELVRQGFLMSAWLDHGLLIRDETLGESMPAGKDVMRLLLAERANQKAVWEFRLFQVDERSQIEDLWNTPPAWQSSCFFETSIKGMYAFAAAIFDCASFDEFPVAMKAVGIASSKVLTNEQKLKQSPNSADLNRWNQALLDVDFVTQFGVVRELHRAIEQHGESQTLLYMLARAYANLSLLTDHHASTACRAYAARAMILSARSARLFPNDDLARLNQLYVWAIVGHFSLALETERWLSDSYRELASDHPWIELLYPYVRVDVAAMEKLASSESSIQPWAVRLWIEHLKPNNYQQWLQKAIQLLPDHIPSAYGAYAMLARHGESLGITRFASHTGPVVLATQLPSKLSGLKDLPQGLEAKCEDLLAAVFNPRVDSYGSLFSAGPKQLAQAARDASTADQSKAISWSALAYMIEEEQFTQASNYLHVATNAVEYSLEDEVEAILEQVGNHRYADWLRVYAVRDRSQQLQRVELLHDLRLSDIRGNMKPMWRAAELARQQKDPDQYRYDPMYRAVCDFTYSGLLDGTGLLTSDLTEWASYVARIFSVVVPQSDLNTRFEMLYTQGDYANRVGDWEKKIGNDPYSFTLLGYRYRQLYASTEDEQYLEGARRCYQRSLEILYNKDTVLELAQVYWLQGDFPKWEETLVSFLNSDAPDFGLERAQVAEQLAKGLVAQGRWRDAKPYAVEAGQTFSGWGLLYSSIVTEGLAEWQESERWIQLAATQYPSYSGFQWYFWCMRTGRGQIDQAAALAKQYFEAERTAQDDFELERKGIYLLLQEDIAGARAAFQAAYDMRNGLRCALMLSRLMRQQGDEAAAIQILNDIERVVVNTTMPRELEEGLLILKLVRENGVNPVNAQEIVDDLEGLEAFTHCVYMFMLARELQANGFNDEAVKLYRDTLLQSRNNEVYATLAGAELAKQFLTSREDDDSLDRAQE